MSSHVQTAFGGGSETTVARIDRTNVGLLASMASSVCGQMDFLKETFAAKFTAKQFGIILHGLRMKARHMHYHFVSNRCSELANVAGQQFPIVLFVQSKIFQ